MLIAALWAGIVILFNVNTRYGGAGVWRSQASGVFHDVFTNHCMSASSRDSSANNLLPSYATFGARLGVR